MASRRSSRRRSSTSGSARRDLVVFDCRHSLADFALGRRLYDESHVPGAFFAGVEDDLAGEEDRHERAPSVARPEAFAQFLRVRAALATTTQIVAYDAGGDMFARALLVSLALDRSRRGRRARRRIRGVDARRLSGHARSRRHARAKARSRCACARSLSSTPHTCASTSTIPRCSCSTRAHRERFSGETEPIDPVAGHIPGARNRWFKENFAPDGTFKSREELRAEFERAGLDPERIVHQCGSGVSAAVNLFAMAHAGLAGSRIYNGSWSEWVADPSRPSRKATNRLTLRGRRNGVRLRDCAGGRSFEALELFGAWVPAEKSRQRVDETVEPERRRRRD